MNKTLIALLVAVSGTLSLFAQAATADDASLTHTQAKDAKIEANADYKASKKDAEADHAVNKADCKTLLSGSTRRACEHDAKAQERKDKADAKLVDKTEKADIKADTK